MAKYSRSWHQVTRWLLVIMISLVSGLIFTTSSSQAATKKWQTGIPKFLQTHKYRTKFKYYQKVPSYWWTRGNKHNFYLKPTQSGAPDSALHAKYYKVNQTYYITGKGAYWNYDHKYLTFKIKKVSSKKIKVTRRFGNQKYQKTMTMIRFRSFSTSERLCLAVKEYPLQQPVAHLVGDFKVSKQGVLMFQDPGNTDDSWSSVSDNPQD